MPPVGFEPTISAGVLNRAATGTGHYYTYSSKIVKVINAQLARIIHHYKNTKEKLL